jgi:hypothetical protein
METHFRWTGQWSEMIGVVSLSHPITHEKPVMLVHDNEAQLRSVNHDDHL